MTIINSNLAVGEAANFPQEPTPAQRVSQMLIQLNSFLSNYSAGGASPPASNEIAGMVHMIGQLFPQDQSYFKLSNEMKNTSTFSPGLVQDFCYQNLQTYSHLDNPSNAKSFNLAFPSTLKKAEGVLNYYVQQTSPMEGDHDYREEMSQIAQGTIKALQFLFPENSDISKSLTLSGNEVGELYKNDVQASWKAQEQPLVSDIMTLVNTILNK